MRQGQGRETRDIQYTNIHGACMLNAKLIAKHKNERSAHAQKISSWQQA